MTVSVFVVSHVGGQPIDAGRCRIGPVMPTGIYGDCEQHCNVDTDCADHDKCCSNGCGNWCANASELYLVS